MQMNLKHIQPVLSDVYLVAIRLSLKQYLSISFIQQNKHDYTQLNVKNQFGLKL